MNKTNIILIIFSIVLISSIAFNVFLYVQVASKNAEIEAKNAEVTSKNNELASINAEIKELKKPKVAWDISYTDVREELALPGYHLSLTGTVTNYGTTKVYNLRLHVIAYDVNGEIAINQTVPPTMLPSLPEVPGGYHNRSFSLGIL